MKKKLASIILAGVMAFSMCSSVLGAVQQDSVAGTSNLAVSPRSVTLDMGKQRIPYNDILYVGRNAGKNVERFYVRAGVPLTFDFSFDTMHYVRVWLFQKHTNGTNTGRVLFVGELQQFNETFVFDGGVEGYFGIENWTAGDITTDHLSITY